MTDALPAWIEPMAATLTEQRFGGPEWSFERKFDGIRLLAFKTGDEVRLYSRNRLLQQLPAIAAAIAQLPVGEAILDGEVDWDGGIYHVFDLLFRDGRSLLSLPLEERRAALAELPFAPPLERVLPLPDDEAPWERAAREGWEGVIAKRCGSTYEQRRSPHWLKMKIEARQELVVGGFTEPQGSRVGLGALLVGHHAADDFIYAGKVGTSLPRQQLLDLRARLDALEVPAAPFTKAVGLPRVGAHWVRPELVVEVAFLHWTGNGKMRHPRLLHLRFDKDARAVVRETPGS